MIESQQSTVGQSFSMTGQGVHSGRDCTIHVHPAPCGHGIRFVRIDLDGEPEIPADIACAAPDMLRQTVLHHPGKPEAEVKTVEHILAAFHAFDIDNARVEMTGAEAPLWDGGAARFAQELDRAGTVDQPEAPRRCLRIDRVIDFEPPGGNGSVSFVAWPSNFLTVTYFLEYDHPAIGRQAASFRVDRDGFVHQIAGARTFCTREELDQLRAMGLAQGGDADSAIVIGPDGPINTPYAWDNELARHKVLDLIGDLRLAGAPVRGHILAWRSGHQSNAQFVKHLRKEFTIQP